MIPRKIVFDVQKSTPHGYEARAVGHPIFSEADSLDELKRMLQDGVSCHFGQGEEPILIRLHML